MVVFSSLVISLL